MATNEAESEDAHCHASCQLAPAELGNCSLIICSDETTIFSNAISCLYLTSQACQADKAWICLPTTGTQEKSNCLSAIAAKITQKVSATMAPSIIPSATERGHARDIRSMVSCAFGPSNLGTFVPSGACCANHAARREDTRSCARASFSSTFFASVHSVFSATIS